MMIELQNRLQDFALQVINICNLESDGKISPQEAYNRLATLLADSYFQIDIDFICSILEWDLNHAQLAEQFRQSHISNSG